MSRVTESDLQEILPAGGSQNLAPFIVTADAIVDDIVTAAALASATISNERAGLVSLYLSAHFAVLSYEDGALASSTVGDASEKYHNVYGEGLKNTRFGQQAMLLDPTGYLARMSAMAENPQVRTAEFRVV
jgi:hypothetical protein